jgi:deazaflavin-dependent oxidoreductase (nitroreductase family)
VSGLTSIVKRLGSQRWFAAVGRRLVPLDRQLSKLTHGRVVAGGLNLPSLLLTTTGRRTGRPRPTPLVYASDGDAFVVIGSNWGGHDHPAWSANLLAHPDATVTMDGQDIPVRARLVKGTERERLRTLLLAIWPGYAAYEKRAPHRRLRIFRLERTGTG